MIDKGAVRSKSVIPHLHLTENIKRSWLVVSFMHFPEIMQNR